MKQLLFLVFMYGTVQTANAQVSSFSVDTLRSILRRNVNDTNRVNALSGLSWHYIFKPGEHAHELDTALLLIAQSRSLSQALQYPKGLGDAAYGSYLAWLEKGNHPRAREYASQAIELFSRYGYWQQLGYLYLDMTRMYTLEQDNLPSKIDCYQKALATFERSGDQNKQGEIYHALADHHQLQENYALALVELQKALFLYRQVGRSDLERIYDLLGFVSTKLGDYQEGLKYGLLALKTAEQQQDSSIQLCTMYNRLGLTYFALGQEEQAHRYYQQALKIARQYQETAYVLHVAGNMADLLLHQRKPEPALDFLNQHVRQFPPDTDETRLIVSLRLLNIYSTLHQFEPAQEYCDEVLDLLAKTGNGSIGRAPIYESAIRFLIYTKQYTQARNYLQLNQAQCLKNGSTVGLSKNHLLWFKLDSAQANYPTAIRHYQHYKILQDSLLNTTKSRHIAQLEIEYQTEKKDQDLKIHQQAIQLLTKQSELQQQQLQQATTTRNAVIGGTVLLILLLILGYNRYLLKQYNNRQLEAKQIEINRKNDSLELIVQEKDHLLVDKDQLLIDKDQLLEEREWMLKEIHHRVKNNLQIITSLLHSQARYLTDNAAVSAIRESQNRVHAMALIHQKLYQSNRLSGIPMDEYIREIIDYLITTFNRANIVNKQISVVPIDLDVTLAVPLGLIINEAVTNSLKYAFLTDQFGTIKVELKEEENQKYQLLIRDDGIGFPANLNPQRSRTLGMSMMRGLCEQIEGTLEIRQQNGVYISVVFSAAKMARVYA